MALENEFLAVTNAVSALQSTATGIIGSDQQTIDALRQQVSSLQSQLALDDAQIANLLGTLPVFFSGLHKDPVWKVEVGAKIGGVAPAKYSFDISSGQLVMSVQGIPGSWCDWLIAKKLTPAQTFNVIILEADIITDGNVAAIQCLEFDTEVVSKGMKFNMSSQIKQSTGELQIASGVGRGGWLNSGAVPGHFLPNTKHSIRWVYTLDRVKKTLRYVAFFLNGKRFDIAPAIGNQVAYSEPTWGDQLTLQLQQDVNSTGGAYKTTFDNVRFIVF